MSDEKDQENNVVSLQEVKEKKELKSPKKNKYQIHKSIYDAIDGNSQINLGRKYWIIKYPSGSRIICIENEKQELLIAGGDDAPHLLLKYSHSMAEFDHRYFMTLKEANAVLETWRARGEAIIPPPPVRFKNDNGLCFRRLDFVPAPGCTDTWESLLDRMSNQRAFMAFVGSLFDNSSLMQQYVWMRGGGGDGKGAIGRWFQEIFRQSFYMTASINSKFWLYSLINKRVCIFSDWNDTALPTSGLFKSLSGGDSTRVEGKYKDEMNVNLNCKYIFFSNFRPEILMQSSDKRRIIYCDFKPLPDGAERGHKSFETKLLAESSAFIYECLKVYKEDCPDHGLIPTLTDEVDELAGGNESYFDGLYDEYFIPGGKTVSAQMSAWMERRRFTAPEKIKWYEFMRNKGARSVKTGAVRAWHGLTLGKHAGTLEAQNSVD
jgi:hypothetical protein